MKLAIDPSAAAPPYEQLRAQVADAVRGGSLPVGARLPTVRGLAADLGLAPNTVARAYRLLEQTGVVRTRGRLGTFVEAASEPTDRAALEAARAYAHRARELDLDDEAAIAWVRSALLVEPLRRRPHRG